jgi:hypothetical protein
MSFEENPASSTVMVERLGHDFVMGVRGPIADEDAELICSRIEEIVKALTEVNLPEPLQQAAEEAVF